MKKHFLFFCVSIVLAFFVACSPSPSKYIPDVRILASKNDGAKWLENLKDIEVGKVFYLRFEVIIQNNGFRDNVPIKYSISIPVTEILDCTLQDYSGESKITPASDISNNFTQYDFTALASKEKNKPKKAVVTFQCKALKSGSHQLLVKFAKKVSKIHQKTITIVYIDSKTE